MDEAKEITIDLDALREGMKQECYGAFFGAGFGGALIESFDIDDASPEELVKMAQDMGIDLRNYQV